MKLCSAIEISEIFTLFCRISPSDVASRILKSNIYDLFLYRKFKYLL